LAVDVGVDGRVGGWREGAGEFPGGDYVAGLDGEPSADGGGDAVDVDGGLQGVEAVGGDRQGCAGVVGDPLPYAP